MIFAVATQAGAEYSANQVDSALFKVRNVPLKENIDKFIYDAF